MHSLGRVCAVLAAAVLGAAAAPAEADVLCVDPADLRVRSRRERGVRRRAGRRPHHARRRSRRRRRSRPPAHRGRRRGRGARRSSAAARRSAIPGRGAPTSGRGARLDGVATRGCASAASVLLARHRVDCRRPRSTARSRWRAPAPTRRWTPCSCGRTAACAHRLPRRARRAPRDDHRLGDGAADGCAGRRAAAARRDRRGRVHAPARGRCRRVGRDPGGPGQSTPPAGCPPGSPLIDAGSPERARARRSGRRTATGCRAWPTATATGSPARSRRLRAPARRPSPLPAGNLLRDPGRRGRRRVGARRRLRARALRRFPFPSAAAGAALGGGRRVLRGRAGGGAHGAPSASTWARVGARRSTRHGDASTLSALLGGFRADADVGSLEATFLDPRGRADRHRRARHADAGGARQRDDAAAAHAHRRGPAADARRSTSRCARARAGPPTELQRRLLRQRRADAGRAGRAAAPAAAGAGRTAAARSPGCARSPAWPCWTAAQARRAAARVPRRTVGALPRVFTLTTREKKGGLRVHGGRRRR